MRKKVVSLITSAVMVTSVFAGMPMNVAAADDDKVITFWSIGTNEPDATILQRAVDTFNETTTSRTG